MDWRCYKQCEERDRQFLCERFVPFVAFFSISLQLFPLFLLRSLFREDKFLYIWCWLPRNFQKCLSRKLINGLSKWSGYIFRFVQSYLLFKTFMRFTNKLKPGISSSELSALTVAFKVWLIMPIKHFALLRLKVCKCTEQNTIIMNPVFHCVWEYWQSRLAQVL